MTCNKIVTVHSLLFNFKYYLLDFLFSELISVPSQQEKMRILLF